MSLQNIIGNVLFVAFPFICLLVVYIYKMAVGRLPDNVITFLQQVVAPMAVHSIEQIYSNSPGPQKKELATGIIIRLLTQAHKPIPSRDAINSAIEQTVLLMNQMPQVAIAKNTVDPLSITRQHEAIK